MNNYIAFSNIPDNIRLLPIRSLIIEDSGSSGKIEVYHIEAESSWNIDPIMSKDVVVGFKMTAKIYCSFNNITVADLETLNTVNVLDALNTIIKEQNLRKYSKVYLNLGLSEYKEDNANGYDSENSTHGAYLDFGNRPIITFAYASLELRHRLVIEVKSMVPNNEDNNIINNYIQV